MYKLRLIQPGDAAAILDYYSRNRVHLTPWQPRLPEEFYTMDYHERRLEHYLQCAEMGEDYRFAVFDGRKMIANINLSAIEHAAFQNGRLGYSVDGEYTGRGVATDNIQSVCRFGFRHLKLHRLEANVMPRNAASKRVLEKCGFMKVGLSPKMIQINGVWEDHEMYAKLVDS